MRRVLCGGDEGGKEKNPEVTKLSFVGLIYRRAGMD